MAAAIRSYFITEQTVEELEQEVDKGKNQRCIDLLEVLGDDKSKHPFIQKEPRICYSLMPLMDTLLSANTIKQDLVEKVTAQFALHHVFSKEVVQENLAIQCIDGQISIDSRLLCFRSEYFATTLRHTTLPDFSKHYQKATLQAMKEYFYTAAFPKTDSIVILKELHDLATLILSPPLKSCCEEQLQVRCKAVTTLKELECVHEGLLYPDAHFLALKSYLFHNKIYYRESLYEKRICLSISCLTHLQDEGLVGRQLRTACSGFYIEIDEDFETLKLLAFMPENLRMQIEEVQFSIPVTERWLTICSKLFPNIKKLEMPFIASKVDHQWLKMHVRDSPHYFFSCDVLVKNDAFAKKHFAHLESISFIKNLEHESKFSENQFFYIGNLPVPSDLLPVTFKWDVRLYCTSQTAESFERATVFQNYSFKRGNKSGEITDSAGQQITVNEFVMTKKGPETI